MFSRLWLWLCSGLRLKYQIYQRTLWWLIFWLAVGMVLAIVSLAVGGIGTGDINYHLIDGNILNMANPDAGIGGFIWQRMVTLFVPVLLLWGLALLSRFTAFAIFPLVLMHGYWLCLSVWWTFMYYSFNAIFLLLFYLVWLVLVTAVLLVALIWVYAWARTVREQRYRCRGLWWPLLRGTLLLLVVTLIMGCFEYLVFWAVLGRIVYKPL